MSGEPGMLPMLRDPSDSEEVRVRLTDGLVHRVHWDYHNLTACNHSLMIINKTKAQVDAVWATWVTQDDVSCLECLCENDKTSAQSYNENPCSEYDV